MTRSRIFVLLLLALAARAGWTGEAPAASDVVALTIQEPDMGDRNSDGGLLIRELARQALLIAARDELGYSTRDAALREPLEASAAAFRLKSQFINGGAWVLMVFQGGNTLPIWHKVMPIPAQDRTDYLDVVAKASELSRKDFPEMLKAAGYAARILPTPGAATITPDVEKNLARLNWAGHFAALRVLHEQIRDAGASPELTLGLVRGYANLGRLTADLWTGENIAYRARALVYADRLVASNPNSPTALWARAYARALAGLHAAALQDVGAAQKIEGKGPGAGWGWKDALILYCNFETDKLAKFADPAGQELALFFRFLTVEHGAQSQTRDAVHAMLRADPECYCVYKSLWKMGGVSTLHQATVNAPETFSDTLKARLSGMPALAPEVAAILRSPPPGPVAERRALLVNALVNASKTDRGEPSWGVLGHMIEDITLVQTAMRGDFMKRIWGVDTSDFVRESLPLVAHHPYHAMIEALALDATRDQVQYRALLKDIDIVDANYSETLLMDMTTDIDTPGKIQGRTAYNHAWLHNDDLPVQIEWGDHDGKLFAAHELMTVSPRDPQAYAALIYEDWDFAKSKAGEWELDFAQSAPVIQALGWRYSQLPSLPDAERCLMAYIRLAPDRWGYETLADIYKKEAAIDKWQRTLDEYLAEVPDPGLEHANVQVKIARYFMSQKQWAKAAPYADAAAGTWAAWGMMAARDCYEGMGDFKTAELWQQRISERYEGSELEWYFWCKRTGEGNVEAAAELAAKHFESVQQRETAEDRLVAGVYNLLEGKNAVALTHFQTSFALKDPYGTLHAVLLADDMKNAELRDKLLAELAGKGQQFKDSEGKMRPALLALAAQFQKLLQGGEGAKLDLAAVDAAVARASPGEQINLNYFTARFLEQHGAREQAIDYYDRAATAGDNRKWNLVLASAALRRLNAKPGEIKRAPKTDKNGPDKNVKDEF